MTLERVKEGVKALRVLLMPVGGSAVSIGSQRGFDKWLMLATKVVAPGAIEIVLLKGKAQWWV